MQTRQFSSLFQTFSSNMSHKLFAATLIGVAALMTGCATQGPNIENSYKPAPEIMAKPMPQLQVPSPPQVQNNIQEIRIKRAQFNQTNVSQEARKMADWVVDSGDNENRPFVIVDKKEAHVYVFYANGNLRGDAPVLLGFTIGDDSIPGIGDRPLSTIKPHEKTTPPGRFLSSLDKNINGKDIVWVDYDGAVSLHAVVKGTPAERRAERLASTTPSDNRISFGCINAPVDFFKTVIAPSFKATDGIVYILPDIRPVNQVFASWYDVDAKVKLANAPSYQPDAIAKFASQTSSTTPR